MFAIFPETECRIVEGGFIVHFASVSNSGHTEIDEKVKHILCVFIILVL